MPAKYSKRFYFLSLQILCCEKVHILKAWAILKSDLAHCTKSRQRDYVGASHRVAVRFTIQTFNRAGHVVTTQFWVHAKLLQSCLTLCDLLTRACQTPLCMGFSRQEYWSGLPCPPPGDLSNPGIEPVSLMSLALAGRFFTTWEAPSTQ